MKNYHAFKFLKKIYFVRTAGSKEELEAANLIKEEISLLGGESYLEEFDIDASKIFKSELIIDDKNHIECAGSGYSLYTDEKGVEGEFLFISDVEASEIYNLKDKIIFCASKRPPHPIYEKAIKDGAKAIVLSTGSVYKNPKDVDLDPYLNRELDYSLGKIPVIMIRNSDMEKIIAKNPKKAKVILMGEDYKAKSHNVVADIIGNEYPEEIITLTAHYDSVSFSKGAYDNGTGVISLLQIYHYFKNNPPKRSMKFIFCGAEEMGLLGSKYFTNTHEEEIKDKIVLNINVDMVAATLGHDIACVSGEESIANYLKFMSLEEGFPLHIYQDVYSSDSTPFADKGVPAITFARLSNPSIGAVIHSHDDVIERLSETNFLNTINFMVKLLSRWANAFKFPVAKNIPDHIKEKIDKYYQRKK